MKRLSKKLGVWLMALLMAVCLSLGLSAVSAEAQSGSISDDFETTSSTKSNAFELNNIVGGNSATHGVLPGDVWGGSVKTGTGYLVYKVDAGQGNALRSLTLDYRAVVSHRSETDYLDNNLKVYASTSPSSFGEPLQTITATSSGEKTNYNLDLGQAAAGNRVLYVKIELNNVTSGAHFEADGKLGLSYIGVKLYGVEIAYTYDADASGPLLKDFNISDDFTKVNASTSHAASFTGLSGGASSHGLVPAPAWGDPINAGTGSLVYELAPENEGTFVTLSFSGSARVGWTNQADLFKDNVINVYASADGADWGEPVYTKAALASGYTAEPLSCDLTAQAQGKSVLFVKVELVHAPGSVSLTYCGVKLFQAAFSGTYELASVTETEPFEYVAVIDAESGLRNLDLNDNLRTMVSGGVTYATIDEYVYASGGVLLEAPELREFYSLKLNMPARCTTYNVPAVENAMTVLVSQDNQSYTAVRAFDTDKDWARKEYSVDLSAATRGWSKVYVKISLAFPENWTSSTDWLAFGTLSFTGGTVARTNFDIVYHNMENASYEGEGNPASYDAGAAFAFVSPVREHYAFGGWYLDRALTQPIAGVTAETLGNLEVYAKWTALAFDLTLDANGGAFGDGSTQKTVQAVYDGTLSRADLPADPELDSASFIGWFCDAECTLPWIFAEDLGTPTVVDGTVATLYAKYGNQVTVTFDYADGATGEKQAVYAVGDRAVRPADPARSGYVFGGWQLDGSAYDFESELTADIRLTAFWAGIYAVEYTGAEGATHSNPASFTCLDPAIVLEAAVKTGYTFDGWYLNGQLVQTLDTSLDGDVTLEARWTVKTYALTLNVSGNGSITPSGLSVIPFTGQEFTVTADEGCRVGSVTVNGDRCRVSEDGVFTVAGIDGDVTVAVSFVARVTVGTSLEQTYPGASDWTSAVYDVYNLAQFTGEGNYQGWAAIDDAAKPGYVVYSLQTPAGATFRSMTVSTRARVFTFEGSVAALRIYVSVDGGAYVLAGAQQSTTDGGKVFDISLPLEISGASSVRIKLEIESGYGDWVCFNGVTVESALTMVTVTFKDGDSILGANASQQKGGVFVPMDPAPHKEGYEFLGWYLDAACTDKVPADYAVAAAMSVYAKWAPVTYEITYHLDGGVGGDNPETYTVTDSFELDAATKENAKFLGWYLTADFSGEPVQRIAAGTAGALNLYAKFLAGTPVSYELDGGENSAANPALIFDEAVELADPTREGYTFAGWYTDAQFNDLVTVLEPDGSAVTVYAKWIKDGGSTGCGKSAVGVAGFLLLALGAALTKRR